MEMPSLHPTSISHLPKCSTSKDHLLVDRLNELPDEILIKILCLVTMKEAAQTSILSRRWIDLWKYTTCLEFDMMHKLRDSWVFGTLEYQQRCLDINDVIDRLQHYHINRSPWTIIKQKQFNYVKWVNRMLDSLQSPTIYKFRVHFNLDVTYKDKIDGWVNFAIGKQVRMLDLDLKTRTEHLYSLPEKVLDHPNVSLLRSLNLNCVDLTNQVLDILLSKIPCMESLGVSNARSLTDTLVVTATPNLKHLEISHCENLKILQIDAFNLKSLTFYGPSSSRLRLVNTPNLVDVSFGGIFCLLRKFVLPKEPETDHFCHRLQSFTLKIPELYRGYFPRIPMLRNLKQLELLLFASNKAGILDCSSLILACPALNKFILGMDWMGLVEKDREIERRKCLLPNSL